MTHVFGFLGLGRMGQVMGRRLVDAGHEVIVWNRTPAAADELVAAGARLAASPAQALAAPVSFSMLADDRAAEAVLTVDNLRGADGRVHINHASISAAAADRLEAVHEQAGVGYVAAPVLGRPPVAAAGQLNILAAGPAALVDAVTPHLQLLGKRVWRLGEVPRQANVAKIAVNFTMLHALQAMAEGISLAESHGIAAPDFAELLAGTIFPGPVYTGYGAMMAERRYSPAGFTLALGLKDLALAEEAAAEAGVSLPSSPLLRDRFEQALADPALDGFDWSAMAEVTRGR